MTIFDAAIGGNLEAVKLFLDQGDNVNATDKDGYSALILASFYGHVEIADLLLKRGAQVDAKGKDGCTALMKAMENGYADVITLLLNSGANVDAIDEHDRTALMEASYYGHANIVKLLLDKGAKINAQDKYGNNALTQASQEGHNETVKILLDHAANVNATTADGTTALMLANLEEGHNQTAKILLEYGADVNAADNGGETALIMAVLKSHSKIVKILLEYGADVNYAKPKGLMTALIYAAENRVLRQIISKENDEIVKLLLEYGADINAKNYWGENALQIGRGTEIYGMISTAAAANAFISNAVEIPEFSPEHNELFLNRIVNSFIKHPDLAQYDRLKQYCTDHNLIDSIAVSLFNEVTKGGQPYINNLIFFDEESLDRMFEIFKATALEIGISDYDKVIMPEKLINDINARIREYKETLDQFESIVRGEIEGIAIIPAELVKQGIDTEDQYYAVGEKTLAYYKEHKDELSCPGAYFARMTSNALIEAMNNLDDEVFSRILHSFQHNHHYDTLPHHVRKIIADINSYYEHLDPQEEVVVADDYMSSLDQQNADAFDAVDAIGAIVAEPTVE